MFVVKSIHIQIINQDMDLSIGITTILIARIIHVCTSASIRCFSPVAVRLIYIGRCSYGHRPVPGRASADLLRYF